MPFLKDVQEEGKRYRSATKGGVSAVGRQMGEKTKRKKQDVDFLGELRRVGRDFAKGLRKGFEYKGGKL